MSDIDSENDDNIEGNAKEFEEKLREIKSQEGIIGYIMRSEKSAAIDLKDPTKMIDYALLSSTMIDVSQNLPEELEMDEINSIIVESDDTKIMSININNNRISIFMEKHVNHDKLYKKLT